MDEFHRKIAAGNGRSAPLDEPVSRNPDRGSLLALGRPNIAAAFLSDGSRGGTTQTAGEPQAGAPAASMAELSRQRPPWPPAAAGPLECPGCPWAPWRWWDRFIHSN